MLYIDELKHAGLLRSNED